MRLLGVKLPRRQSYRLGGPANMGRRSFRSFSGPSFSGWETLSTPTAYDSPVVYACVHKISSTLSTLPRKVRRLSDNEETAPPFWMERPNSYQGGGDFIKSLVASMLLWGEAFILPMRNSRGEVVTAAVANPQYVSHYVQGDAVVWYFNGIVYSGEVIHLRNDAIPGRVRGIPLHSIMVPISETNRVAQQYIYQVVEQGGAYQLAIVYPHDTEAGQDVLDATVDEVLAKHAGPDNAYKPLVLSGGAVITPMNQSNADGQFVDLSDMTAKQIAQFWFGLDDTIMGFKSNQPQHYQNAPSVWYRYWAFGCAHLHAEIERGLTLMLNRNLYADLDPGELLLGGPHDRAKLAMEMADTNKKMGLVVFTPDEMREVTGKHPLPEYEPMAAEPEEEPEDEEDDKDSGEPGGMIEPGASPEELDIGMEMEGMGDG